MMQLKRTLIREGLFKEIKKRKFHCKPSLAKRLKREAAAKQRNKDLKREIRAALKADFQGTLATKMSSGYLKIIVRPQTH